MSIKFHFGDLTLFRIIEEESTNFSPFSFFPSVTKELIDDNRSWLEPSAIDPLTGNLRFCIQSYLVCTPQHTILVDTCLGNHKDLPHLPFWHRKNRDTWQRNLAATGFTLEQIDYVMCTHLHVDHVGWNTRLENGHWVPTFPNARYLFSEKDFAHVLGEHKKTPNPVFAESVLPVVEAGRADFIKSDLSLNDHVRLIPTPGHTPDHFAIELGKGKTETVLTGDLIHSPLQARFPEVSFRGDFDVQQGIATRRTFLKCQCESERLVCTAHFPSPSIGRFTAWGDGFRFNPEVT